MLDWRWTYTSPDGDSVVFGCRGDDLVTQQVEGLDGFDDVRSSTIEIPRGHGGVKGKHFLPPRTPVFRLKVASSAMTGVREAALRALNVQTDGEGTLEWQRPGEARRRLFCRPVVVRWPTTFPAHVAEPRVAFEAADPRMYAAAGKQASLEPFSTSGGVDDPVDDPKDAAVFGADVPVTNDGNTGSPPVLRFFGPSSGTCTGVQLTNRTTGVEFDVQTDIIAGQILTVDVRAHVAATGARVIDLSAANRYGSWVQPRTPLLIAKGSNLLRMTADGTTTGMSCQVLFSDAWTA